MATTTANTNRGLLNVRAARLGLAAALLAVGVFLVGRGIAWGDVCGPTAQLALLAAASAMMAGALCTLASLFLLVSKGRTTGQGGERMEQGLRLGRGCDLSATPRRRPQCGTLL